MHNEKTTIHTHYCSKDRKDTVKDAIQDTKVANREGVYQSIPTRETKIYEGPIHLREFRVARSQDPQREGHDPGGMKSVIGRTEWDEV
jgi:hypothetical protein